MPAALGPRKLQKWPRRPNSLGRHLGIDINMARRWLLVGAGALLGAASSCAGSAPVWDYKGERGPPAWATLDPAYAACASGRSQSPIDVVEVLPRDLPNLDFRYGPAAIDLHNDGRAIEQRFAPGNALRMGNLSFALSSLRVHAPSEHRAAGISFAMELQWLHKSPQGHLAIVAVMVKPGDANPALGMLIERLPMAAGDESQSPAQVPLAQLLPKERTYMRYSGSLTQPPCWENVMWMILSEPIEASPSQIAAFTRLHRDNVRPVAPVGKRSVFFDATP